jgi:hypothetical protein
MNNAVEVSNYHGGKEFYNCMCRSVSGQNIEKNFDRWIQFGDKVEDAKGRSTLVDGVWNTRSLARKRCPHRSRQNILSAQGSWILHSSNRLVL